MQRIIAPVLRELRIASWLSVAAGTIWPLQAAAIAWAVSEWVSGASALSSAVPAAAIFALGALIRAGLEYIAGGLLFEAADKTISRERTRLIEREARAPAEVGSAAIAALLVQKLPLLQPWITRYHVAKVRLIVLPILLLLLTFPVSWVVGTTLLIAGPLIPVFMMLIGIAAEQASLRQMREISSMNELAMDRLSALLDIRLLGATERAVSDFSARVDDLRSRTMAVLRIAFLSSTVLELFAALGVAMVAVFVGFTLLGELKFGTWGTELSLGEGMFLLLIAPEFFQPFRDLAAAWHDRAAGLAVVAELEALDGADRVRFVGSGHPARPIDGPIEIGLSSAVVALRGKSVSLPPLHVNDGEMVALSGPSGAGKSTMLGTIAGLIPLESGTLRVCRTPLTEATADAWRARIALMPQRPHFPDLPLADWLDIAKTGVDPWPILRLVEAADVVERLPDGLATRLGESGGGVSGGEARRLLLARTLLTGADVILADEPTADLDPETASQIIRALIKIRSEGRTLIVATHDPNLIVAMDRMVELPA